MIPYKHVSLCLRIQQSETFYSHRPLMGRKLFPEKASIARVEQTHRNCSDEKKHTHSLRFNLRPFLSQTRTSRSHLSCTLCVNWAELAWTVKYAIVTQQ